MKFHKVFVERTQWAVVFIATEDLHTGSDLVHCPAAVANAAKSQVDDPSIWTDASFKVDSVEQCDNRYDIELCDFMQ